MDRMMNGLRRNEDAMKYRSWYKKDIQESLVSHAQLQTGVSTPDFLKTPKGCRKG
jgi:hypothetical protein